MNKHDNSSKIILLNYKRDEIIFDLYIDMEK